MPTANLTLTIHPGPDVLHRVICICRRRNLEILALSYEQQRIALTLAGADRQVSGIERWLASLVHVFDVQRADLAPVGALPMSVRSPQLPPPQH
jgi:acetolactate synthase small subunit